MDFVGDPVNPSIGSFGVKPGQATDCKWFECSLCGFYYPETDLTEFEGRRYCIPNTCYKDISSIIRSRMSNRKGGVE